MVLFICSVVFFWEAAWEISRKVYAVTRKYQEMGFITNFEHTLSHPWFAPVVGKLSPCRWGRQREQVSQRPCSSGRVPSGKQKAGRSRCFHDLLQGWEREGQGTALLLGKTRASPEATKPAAPGESGRSYSGQCRDAGNRHPRRPAAARSELPSRRPPPGGCPPRGPSRAPPGKGRRAARPSPSAGREEGCC